MKTRPTDSKEFKTELTSKPASATKQHDPVLIKELSDLAGFPLPEIPINALTAIQVGNRKTIGSLLSLLAGVNTHQKIYESALFHLLQQYNLILNIPNVDLFTVAFMNNNVKIIRHLQAHGVQLNVHQDHLADCFAKYAEQQDKKSDLPAKVETLKQLLSTPNLMQFFGNASAYSLQRMFSLPQDILQQFLPLMYPIIKAEGLRRIQYRIIENPQDLESFLQRILGVVQVSDEKKSAPQLDQVTFGNKMRIDFYKHCYETLAVWLGRNPEDRVVCPDPAIEKIVADNKDAKADHFEKLSDYMITADNTYLIQAMLNRRTFTRYEARNPTLLQLAISQGKLNVIHQLITHVAYKNVREIFQFAFDANNYKNSEHLFGAVNTLLSYPAMLADITIGDLIATYLQCPKTVLDLRVILLRKIRIKMNDLVKRESHSADREASDVIRYEALLPGFVKNDPELLELLLQWGFQATLDYNMPTILAEQTSCVLSDLRSIAEYETEQGLAHSVREQTLNHMTRANMAHTVLSHQCSRDDFYYDQNLQLYNFLTILSHSNPLNQFKFTLKFIYSLDACTDTVAVKTLSNISLEQLVVKNLLACNVPEQLQEIAVDARLRLQKMDSTTSIQLLLIELTLWNKLTTFNVEDARPNAVYCLIKLAERDGADIKAHYQTASSICDTYLSEAKQVSLNMLDRFTIVNSKLIQMAFSNRKFNDASEILDKMQMFYTRQLRLAENQVDMLAIADLRCVHSILSQNLLLCQLAEFNSSADKILAGLVNMRIEFERLFHRTKEHIDPMLIYLDTLAWIIKRKGSQFKPSEWNSLLIEVDELLKTLVNFFQRKGELKPDILEKSIRAFAQCLDLKLRNSQVILTADHGIFQLLPISTFSETPALRRYVSDAALEAFGLHQFDIAIDYAKSLMAGYAHKRPSEENDFAQTVRFVGFYCYQKALHDNSLNSADEKLKVLNEAIGYFLKIAGNELECVNAASFLAKIYLLKAQILLPNKKEDARRCFTLAKTQLEKMEEMEKMKKKRPLDQEHASLLMTCNKHLFCFSLPVAAPIVKPKTPEPKLSDVKTTETPVPKKKRELPPTVLPFDSETHKLNMQWQQLQTKMSAYFSKTTHLELHAERKRDYDADLKEVLDLKKKDKEKTPDEMAEQKSAFCLRMNDLYEKWTEHDQRAGAEHSKKSKLSKSTPVNNHSHPDKLSKKAKKKAQKNHESAAAKSKNQRNKQHAGSNVNKPATLFKARKQAFDYRFVVTTPSVTPAEKKRSTLQHAPASTVATTDLQSTPRVSVESTTQSILNSMRRSASADEKSLVTTLEAASSVRTEDDFEPGLPKDLLALLRAAESASSSVLTPSFTPKERKSDAVQTSVLGIFPASNGTNTTAQTTTRAPGLSRNTENPADS